MFLISFNLAAPIDIFEPFTTPPIQATGAPPIYTDEPFEDRKSVFQAHLSPVHSKEEVELVLQKLKENKKIAHATHNIYAYR